MTLNNLKFHTMPTLSPFLLLLTCAVMLCVGKESDFILIESRDGLSNRLRVLAGYMAVVAHVYNTSHIVMVWELNVACNGHFLEIFQPLENVTFITPSQRPLFKQHALAYDGPSHGNFLQFFTRFKLETLFPTINSRLELEKRQYRLFKPVSLVINEVFQFVKRHHICGCIGLHVRQTDLADYLKSLKKINSSSLTPYFEFIDSHSATNVSSTLDSHSRHPCVYLMTDNPTTQQTFLKRYGSSRLLVYKRISSTPEEGSIRFTSLFHTLVDVLITAFTYDFKPSFYSSVHDTWSAGAFTQQHQSTPITKCEAEGDLMSRVMQVAEFQHPN